jgi:hypothetical protein
MKYVITHTRNGSDGIYSEVISDAMSFEDAESQIDAMACTYTDDTTINFQILPFNGEEAGGVY